MLNSMQERYYEESSKKYTSKSEMDDETQLSCRKPSLSRIANRSLIETVSELHASAAAGQVPSFYLFVTMNK